MNGFQQQLIVSGKSLAELPDLNGVVYSRRILSPARVSVEEFLALTDDPDEPEVTEPDERPMPTDDESEEEDTES